MKDFTAWVDAWNAYDSATFWMFVSYLATLAGILLVALGVGCLIGSIVERDLGVGIVSAVVAAVGVALMVSCFHSFPSEEPKAPPALATRIAKVWGLERIDCGGWFPTGNLPADGDDDCVAYTPDRRFDVTVHVDGKEVGLYLNDGKALKPLGKDVTE